MCYNIFIDPTKGLDVDTHDEIIRVGVNPHAQRRVRRSSIVSRQFHTTPAHWMSEGTYEDALGPGAMYQVPERTDYSITIMVEEPTPLFKRHPWLKRIISERRMPHTHMAERSIAVTKRQYDTLSDVPDNVTIW